VTSLIAATQRSARDFVDEMDPLRERTGVFDFAELFSK
jgi:hypothetical protein